MIKSNLIYCHKIFFFTNIHFEIIPEILKIIKCLKYTQISHERIIKVYLFQIQHQENKKMLVNSIYLILIKKLYTTLRKRNRDRETRNKNIIGVRKCSLPNRDVYYDKIVRASITMATLNGFFTVPESNLPRVRTISSKLVYLRSIA